MGIVIAAALLIFLLSRTGKRGAAARPAPGKTERGELAWIDEIEEFNAATDDFL